MMNQFRVVALVSCFSMQALLACSQASNSGSGSGLSEEGQSRNGVAIGGSSEVSTSGSSSSGSSSSSDSSSEGGESESAPGGITPDFDLSDGPSGILSDGDSDGADSEGSASPSVSRLSSGILLASSASYIRYPFLTGFDFVNDNTDACGYSGSEWEQNFGLHKISFGISSVSTTAASTSSGASTTYSIHAGWEDISGKAYGGSWRVYHSNLLLNQKHIGVYEGAKSFSCDSPESGECTFTITLNTVTDSAFQGILTKLSGTSYGWSSFVRSVEAEYGSGVNRTIKDLEYRISSEDLGSDIIQITLTTNMNGEHPVAYSGTFRYGLLVFNPSKVGVKTLDYDEASDENVGSNFKSEQATGAFSFQPRIGNTFAVFSGIGFDRNDSEYKAARLYQRARVSAVGSSKTVTSVIDSVLHQIESDGKRFSVSGGGSATRTAWADRCDADSYNEEILAPENSTAASTIRVVACLDDTVCKVESSTSTVISTDARKSQSESGSL